MVASLDSCLAHVNTLWGVSTVRDICPLSCGCCTRGDECVCDDDEGLRKFVKNRYGFHIPSCKVALQYVCCDNRFFGPYLEKYCHCSCSHALATAE